MHKFPFLMPLQQRLGQIVRGYHHYRPSFGPPIENYYDILQLKRDCTNQDIRDAFVRLSKKFHPDARNAFNANTDASLFVKINEAYQVLSKPKLRNAYDQKLYRRGHWTAPTVKPKQPSDLTTPPPRQPWQIHVEEDPNPGAYYGVDGVERKSNSLIAWWLLGITMVGGTMMFLAVKHSFSLRQNQLDAKSVAASQHHNAVRENAMMYGNEEQLRRLVDRVTKIEEE